MKSPAPSEKTDSTAGKPLNPVASLLSELIDINSEIFELKENVVAKGVPYNTLNVLVELLAVGKESELKDLKHGALQTAASQYGAGSVQPGELDNVLSKLADLEDDLAHVRKVARGQSLDPQAINLLTNVMRQNPGDRGAAVLGKIYEYAAACDIAPKVENLQQTTSAEPAVKAPESVLPRIEIDNKNSHGWRKHKQLGIEVVIGAFFTWCALSLLT